MLICARCGSVGRIYTFRCDNKQAKNSIPLFFSALWFMQNVSTQILLVAKGGEEKKTGNRHSALFHYFACLSLYRTQP